MVRVNTKSVFGKLDLEDASSLRRLMIGLDYILSDTVTDSSSPRLQLPQGDEREVMLRIQSIIRGQRYHGTDLLLRATLRFLEYHNASDESVLAAAQDLEELAGLEVFNSPVVYRDEYDAAAARFQMGAGKDTFLRGRSNLMHRAPGAFGNLGESGRTGPALEAYRKRLNPTWFCDPTPPIPQNQWRCNNCVSFSLICMREKPTCWNCITRKWICVYSEPRLVIPSDIDNSGGDSNGDGDSDSDGDSDNVPGNQRMSEHSDFENTSTGIAVPLPSLYDTASERDLNKLDYLEEEPAVSKNSREYSSEEDEHDPARISEGYNGSSANRPVRKPGQRIIDNGNFDREPAVLGTIDPSKMVISFDVDMVKKTGEVVPDGRAHFRYRHQVKWDDVNSVKALQRWRSQNFTRHLGPLRPARQIWLESERELLFDVLQRHLVDVGGRWSRIVWEKVAASYNKQMFGIEQKAGESAAERLYTFTQPKKGKRIEVTTVSKGQKLAHNRIAPKRTALGVFNQFKVFTHRTAQKIVEQAKEEDRKARAMKGKNEKASPEPESPVHLGDETDEDDQEEDYPIAGDGSFAQDGHGIHDQEMDEDMDDEVPSRNALGPNTRASRLAWARQTAAAKETQVSGSRQAAKDRAGNKWLKGG